MKWLALAELRMKTEPRGWEDVPRLTPITTVATPHRLDVSDFCIQETPLTRSRFALIVDTPKIYYQVSGLPVSRNG